MATNKKEIWAYTFHIKAEKEECTSLLSKILSTLKEQGLEILDSFCEQNAIEEYLLYHPDLRIDGFRVIKITAGMTQEFEIILTNAPNAVIKANLQYVSTQEEEGNSIDNPYQVIEAMGFTVTCLGCQDDFNSEDLENAVIDEYFDYYDI